MTLLSSRDGDRLLLVAEADLRAQVAHDLLHGEAAALERRPGGRELLGDRAWTRSSSMNAAISSIMPMVIAMSSSISVKPDSSERSVRSRRVMARCPWRSSSCRWSNRSWGSGGSTGPVMLLGGRTRGSWFEPVVSGGLRGSAWSRAPERRWCRCDRCRTAGRSSRCRWRWCCPGPASGPGCSPCRCRASERPPARRLMFAGVPEEFFTFTFRTPICTCTCVSKSPGLRIDVALAGGLEVGRDARSWGCCAGRCRRRRRSRPGRGTGRCRRWCVVAVAAVKFFAPPGSLAFATWIPVHVASRAVGLLEQGAQRRRAARARLP